MKNLDPVHTQPGTLENGLFFSEYGYRPNASDVFGHRKRRFSNTLCRVESFENGDSPYLCGRAKTETHFRFQKSPLWRAFLNASVFGARKSRLRVDGSRIRRKKSSFSKIPGYVWTGSLTTIISGIKRAKGSMRIQLALSFQCQTLKHSYRLSSALTSFEHAQNFDENFARLLRDSCQLSSSFRLTA